MTKSGTSTDPRALRTQQLLRDALMEMVGERRWDKIRVQDILDRTGISRSAFYSHFDNKYDLLTANMPNMTAPGPAEDHPGLDVLGLFEHVDDMAEVLRPLLSQPVLGEIAATMHRLFADAWRAQLADTKHADDWVLIEMLAGGLFAAAKTYATRRDREPPQEIANKFADYYRAILT